MNTKLAHAVFAVAVLVAGTSWSGVAAQKEGLALAIVYDTSGSMRDTIRDGAGKFSPKYKIANRALEGIAAQIQRYASNGSGGSRVVHAALLTFDGSGTREVVKFGPYDAKAIQDWARQFSSPGSGTPLGAAVEAASRLVMKSDLSRRHILVITDGMNTVGRDPAAVLPGLKKNAEKQGKAFSLHFVAFDVDAKVFDRVKKQGATVVGAADEKQLNTQLDYILQQKILLEEEEPK